jgi:hypothetical protein
VLLDVSTLLAIEEGAELASVSSISPDGPDVSLSDTVSAA